MPVLNPWFTANIILGKNKVLKNRRQEHIIMSKALSEQRYYFLSLY